MEPLDGRVRARAPLQQRDARGLCVDFCTPIVRAARMRQSVAVVVVVVLVLVARCV